MTLTRRAIFGSFAASLVCLERAQAQMSGMMGMSGAGLSAPPVRILEARKVGVRLGASSRDTPCWGYEGVTPGPLLRVKQGEELHVRLVNKLDAATTLHWHGLRNENAMDGVAGLTQPGVAPGATFDYRFRAADSGMYLYRPAGVSAEQSARGLGGLLIVDEASPPDVDRDMAFVIQDWAINPDGAFIGKFGEAYAAAGAGRLGGLLSANGAAAPLRETLAPGARVRLRLANACAARIAVLTFAGLRPFVMAIDGQPCEAFEPVRNILPIAPGARFDLMIDMPASEGAEGKIILKDGETTQKDLAIFSTKGAARGGRPPIVSLAPNLNLPAEIRLGQAKKIQLTIDAPKSPGARWTINGQSGGYGGRPVVSVKRGTPMSIAFINKSATALAMHVHGQAMRLLHDMDDGWEPYWRNAVIVPRHARKIVALAPQAPGKWAVRCDIADHEAAGLATWIEVT